MGLSDLDFRSRKAHLHVLSVQTGKLVIDWCKARDGHKNIVKPRLSPTLPRQKSGISGIWLTSKEAGKILGICVHAVRNLIRVNLLQCSWRKEKGGGFIIDKVAVEIFKARYISITEASALIQIKVNGAFKYLKKNEVIPITGPGIDTNKSYYFQREQLVEFVKKVQKLRDKQGNGYSIGDASLKLKLSVSTIVSLIKLKILLAADHNSDMIQKKIRRRLLLALHWITRYCQVV
jgi:hypothetical protein